MRKSHTHEYRPTCQCWRCVKTRGRVTEVNRMGHAGVGKSATIVDPIATFAAELEAQPGAAVAPFALVAPPNDAIDASQLRLVVEPSSDAGALLELIRRSKVQS